MRQTSCMEQFEIIYVATSSSRKSSITPHSLDVTVHSDFLPRFQCGEVGGRESLQWRDLTSTTPAE